MRQGIFAVPAGCRYSRTNSAQTTRETLAVKRGAELTRQLQAAADEFQKASSEGIGQTRPPSLRRQKLTVATREQADTQSAAVHRLAPGAQHTHRRLGTDHPDTLACEVELGAARVAQKKYAEAEPLLCQGYERLQAAATKAPAEYARVSAKFGQLQKALGATGAALRGLEQAGPGRRVAGEAS